MQAPVILILLVALNGFSAVLLGALGAHVLSEQLSANESLGAWQTASQYHLGHAVASVATLAWAAATQARAGARTASLNLTTWFWQIGCILFSGSIYMLALGGPRFLGPVTPLGGLAFLTGWGLLAVETLRRPRSSSHTPST